MKAVIKNGVRVPEIPTTREALTPAEVADELFLLNRCSVLVRWLKAVPKEARLTKGSRMARSVLAGGDLMIRTPVGKEGVESALTDPNAALVVAQELSEAAIILPVLERFHREWTEVVEPALQRSREAIRDLRPPCACPACRIRRMMGDANPSHPDDAN